MKIRAKKSLGQNFLKDQEILNKIIKAGELAPSDYIIEIGPGFGALTKELITRTKEIDAIELDSSMIPILKGNLSLIKEEKAKINIINQNVLDVIPPNVKYKVIANIPYYLTSPILNHYLKDIFLLSDDKQNKPIPPSSLVLLVQYEVAQKVCTLNKKYSVLSLNVLTFADAEIITKVPPSAFSPAPKVDSAVLKIKVLTKPKVNCDLKLYFKLIHAGFKEKRKMLKNSLIRNSGISKEKIEEAFIKQNLPAQIRAERLTFKDWENLTNYFS